MSVKPFFSAALLLTALGFGVVRGQGPAVSGGTPLDTGTVPGGLLGGRGPGMPGNLPPKTEPDIPTPPLPDYVTYMQPGCCGSIGGNGPILEEPYLRGGLSFPVAGHIFGHTLEMGWEIEGGGRTMLFNSAMDAAWSLEIGLGNVFNLGQHSDIHVPLSVLALNNIGTAQRVNFGSNGLPGVTIKTLNRTFFSYALGREWYLLGTANAPGRRWRAGIDLGGLYGSAKAEFHEIRHRTDVFEGGYVAMHTDVEIPCCSVVFLAGVRAEWSYTACNILQDHDSDVQDINLLLTAGVRF